ncbi:histone-lysine N-methyltransferase EZA1-like [Dorcoceras hygrometricum]|uniref:Histone-lysine N-methyltransferase EZA1-like n=1 Tax=Dorcoceras hygrometricum TaxID=472368 RepID=A0A2Z7BZL6_9LAMI|nr:histone-lysine N-methyltransferase EZA1-like [Dorcoceras hygrometricum]
MVSNALASKSRKTYGEQGSDAVENLMNKLTQLEKQIQSERIALVGKNEKNSQKVQAYVSELKTSTESRNDPTAVRLNDSGNFLSLRMVNPLCKVTGLAEGSADRDANNNSRENTSSEDIAFSVTAKLPLLDKLLPYTTWIFLDRNQRMADDQSVVGRRRIYYDQQGSEALICSDSEEEFGGLEGQKHEFSEAEDRMLRMAFQEYGVSGDVLNILTQFVGGNAVEIEERCNMLMEKDRMTEEHKRIGEVESESETFLVKSLTAALDSFDNLFCRRCLIFDCLLHGCSQNLIYPSEKQYCSFDTEEDSKVCGDQCYLEVRDSSTNKGKEAAEVPLKDVSDSVGNSIEGSVKQSEWRPFEEDLFLKGTLIFGRNRNLLPGLKTCKEVSTYMYGDAAVIPCGSSSVMSHFSNDVGKARMDNAEPELPVKTRICRKRGRARKVKSSWKSAGHPSLWRRIAEGKDEPYKQYVPCGCQSLCGKQCPCLQIGTCCEKYCAQKAVKIDLEDVTVLKVNAKAGNVLVLQLDANVTPMFAEIVGCGDGSLGEPPKQGDGQCGNMRLLLRQQQRILLAKSDVAGWGAFLKNSVNKNDYLGEYTGELITHREADKRGKIYDRANSSYDFDLLLQYVLDAFRKGDKLKFANHSSTPNCYAKVMLVAGDHRVGIFANERIEAGEELFYDYRYGPDQAPAWARKPEGSKRDGSPVTHGRPKKHQSG